MTTLTRSRRNDNVLIGFFVLIVAGIAVRLAFAGSTVAAIVFGVLAAAIVGFGLWLRGQPALQLHIDADAVACGKGERRTRRITRQASGGTVVFNGVIRKGRLYVNLTTPGAAHDAGIPLDGFDGQQVADACAAHGWAIERSGR